MVDGTNTDQPLPEGETSGVTEKQERTEEALTDILDPPAEIEDLPLPTIEIEAVDVEVADAAESILNNAGMNGAMRYTQAVAEINDLVEGINAELRSAGSPPRVRLKIYRRLPEYAACWLPAIPLQLGAPVDFELIGEEYGGGMYDLTLQKGGKNVKGARWKGIPFGGPPKMLPGEGVPPPTAPLVYQGSGQHRGVQVVAQTPAPDPGVAQLAEGIRMLAEGFATSQQTLTEAITQMRTDIEDARRNPPDMLEGLARSIENVKAVVSLADGLRPEQPPAPEPTTVISSESKIAETIAIVDAVTQRLPGLLAGASQLLGSQSDPGPSGRVRALPSVAPTAQRAPAPVPAAVASPAPTPAPTKAKQQARPRPTKATPTKAKQQARPRPTKATPAKKPARKRAKGKGRK